MARTKRSHQSRINFISDRIREIAYEDQQTTEFQSGDEVEVASKDEGYVGSYYHATFLHPFDADHYIVQYKTLVTDDDETAPLEEKVRVSEVRPVPPNIPHHQIRPLEIYDMVDAYDNDGWWFGVITGKDEDEDEQMYHVHFPTTGENTAFTIDKLRFHQEWSDRKWIFRS